MAEWEGSSQHTSQTSDEAAVASDGSSEHCHRRCSYKSGKGTTKAAKHRRYRKRRSHKQPSVQLVSVLGRNVKVCRKLAHMLLQVSAQRVQRIMDGLPRGHGGSALKCLHPQMDVAMRFLWLKYQFDAEGLPDRWHFDCRSGKELTVGTRNRTTLDNAVTFKLPGRVVATNGNSSDEEALPSGLDYHDTLEEETRAIASVSLHAVLSDQAGPAVLVGPGVLKAPRRYIGVMRPVHLHLFCQMWCKHENISPPGFTTFLRALEKASPWLRFRKVAGQHANCDECMHFKKAIREARSSPAQHSHLLEDT